MPLTMPPRPFAFAFFNGVVTTTNIPAALQEYASNTATRWMLDLSLFLEAKVTVCVAVAAAGGANLRVQYSTDNSTFSDLTTNASLAVLASPATSTWSSIPDAAKGQEVFLRIVTSGGNATDDPATVQVVLNLR